MHEWASRHLFKRASFHPEVRLVAHQEGGAAVVFREIHRLHSPTRRLVDRWRLAQGAAEILLDGQCVGPGGEIPAGNWAVLRYERCAVAIRALTCRVPAPPDTDANPQRRTQGNLAERPVRVVRDGDGLSLEAVLAEGREDTWSEPLLFTGWCVVLLDRPEDVGGLLVEESFRDDGDSPAHLRGADSERQADDSGDHAGTGPGTC